MSFPQGLAFRATSGYVTDFNAYDDPEVAGGADYPRTTVQGNTVGWEDSISGNTRNRNASNPSELAGLNFTTASGIRYRVDLPATGSYDINFAAGDAIYSQVTVWDLYDTTSLLVHLTTGNTSGGNKFKDATDTEYSAAAWRGSNTKTTQTFASTILRVKSATASTDVIAYLSVKASGGGGGTFVPLIGGPGGVAGMPLAGVGGGLVA